MCFTNPILSMGVEYMLTYDWGQSSWCSSLARPRHRRARARHTTYHCLIFSVYLGFNHVTMDCHNQISYALISRYLSVAVSYNKSPVPISDKTLYRKKSRSRKIVSLDYRIALKFDNPIGNTAADVPVKCQSDRTFLNTNLAALRS